MNENFNQKYLANFSPFYVLNLSLDIQSCIKKPANRHCQSDLIWSGLTMLVSRQVSNGSQDTVKLPTVASFFSNTLQGFQTFMLGKFNVYSF